MDTLREMIAGPHPVCAPLVLNPLMAKMAEAAGHKALYLGGGATGYAKAVLEANLNLTEMVHAGLEIRAVTGLPLILDAAGGWGDPMHMHRAIAMAEAAGFAAIEIEDQLLPKRAHHHIGIEHMIPRELMEAKVREAVAERSGRSAHRAHGARAGEMLLIARTNAVRASTMDDALARGEAYRKAGADVLLLSPRNAEEARIIGERLEPPLMYLCPPGGLAAIGLTPGEMHALGFRLLADPSTPLLAAFEAMEAVYRELPDGFALSSRTPESWHSTRDALHDVIGLQRLLDIERKTVEKK